MIEYKNFVDDYKPDIIECLSNLSNDELFTPPKMVMRTLDLFSEEIWENKNIKFLDPGCKSGVFLREITKRLMTGLSKDFPNENERRKHIFNNMVKHEV